MSNAQLWKTLTEVQSRETELKAETATLQIDLLNARTREATLQSLLDKERRLSEEWLV